MKKLPRKITVTCTLADWKKGRYAVRDGQIASRCALAQTLIREIDNGHSFRVSPSSALIDGERYDLDMAGYGIVKAFDMKQRIPPAVKSGGAVVTLTRR